MQRLLPQCADVCHLQDNEITAAQLDPPLAWSNTRDKNIYRIEVIVHVTNCSAQIIWSVLIRDAATAAAL